MGKARNTQSIREHLVELVRFHRTMAAAYFEDPAKNARHTDELNKALGRLKEMDEERAE